MSSEMPKVPEEGLSEETYDPDDWEAFRELAHRMVDDMLDHLRDLPNQPAWQEMPDETQTRLREPLPVEPQGLEHAYADFVRHVLPYSEGNLHPRFYGWVQANGTPLGMMADMLAAGMNPSVAGFNQSPRLVEHQVIGWLSELLGMPASSSGLLVSGGTVANIIGVAVARHTKAGFDVHAQGLQQPNSPKLICYCSSETHGWINRAMNLLGLGAASLRKIVVGSDYRMDVAQLRSTVQQDIAANRRPICVIATCGTVNTGAVDDLEAIADLCKEFGIWFHVDGAFGALATLSESGRDLVHGIEQADSIAFDLHKWGYLPYEIGCILVRDADAHTAAFQLQASYLDPSPRGVIAGGLPFAERGLELTRSFKALKAWLSFKAYGTAKLGRLIEQNIQQARLLAQLAEASDDLELLAPVPLNVVCFRYRADVPETALDEINHEIMLRMQENGSFVLSSTKLNGTFALRAAIVNHRAKTHDFEDLAKEVVRQGNDLLSEFHERDKAN